MPEKKETIKEIIEHNNRVAKERRELRERTAVLNLQLAQTQAMLAKYKKRKVLAQKPKPKRRLP